MARRLRSGHGVFWKLHVQVLVAVVAALCFAVPSWAGQVVIDDFSGGVLGTRTVNLLPAPGTSTTPPGTFSESGGVATMTMSGNGNGQGGVELIYNFSATDLTDGFLNRQFFLEYPQIQRSPENPGDTALSISIQVTDSNGTVGYFGTSVSSASPINIVLNFYCSDGGVCFSPQPDWTSITKVDVTMLFPSTHVDSTTTAVLDIIRTTPSGGAPPNPPNPVITPGSDPDCSSPVGFSVDFGNDVTGFTSGDILISGTAPGTLAASVSGGPRVYSVNVTGMTGGGTVAIQVPADAAIDNWGQGNVASSVVGTNFGQAPAMTSANAATFVVGTAGSFTATASGSPAPTIALSGTLPSGLGFSSPTISGTAAAGTGGSYPLTFSASNTCGNASQSFTLTANQAPAITSANATTFTVGTAGSFTVTSTGYPTPTLSVTGTLPNGVTFDPTTGLLSGTPAAGTGGVHALTVTADNGIGTPAQQSFTLTLNEAPAITSSAATTFTVGAPGSFTVSATGYPAPTLAMTGSLPSGVAFDPPTGVLSGTPASGSVADYPVTVTASNGIGTPASQDFTLTVQKAGTTTSITSQLPDPSVVGEQVTVHYSVEVVAPATGTPTGTVTVGDGVDSCSGAVSDGTCTLTLTTVGSRTLTASYAGDQDFLSSSTTASHTVNQAATTTTITSHTPSPSVLDSPVTVTFTVTVDAPGSGTPTGTVTIGDGVDSCSATVAEGACTLTLHTSGMRTLTASYPGDASFTASEGSVQHEVLDQSDLDLATSLDPAVLPPSQAFGQIFTVTNLGPSLDQGVSLTISLPAGAAVSNIDPSPACSNADGTVTCTIGDLAANGQFAARIDFTADSSGFYSSTGTVTGTVTDPDPDNNSVTATTTMGQLLASPSPVVMRAEIGSTTSGNTLVTNDSPLDVDFSVLERNWRPITAPLARPVQPATRQRPAGLERRPDARGIEKLVPDPDVPLDQSAGTVLSSFPTGLALPWGLGLDVRSGDFWVSDLGYGGGDDQDHRYLSDGTPTGDAIDTSAWVSFVELDMTYDPYTDKLWQTNYDEGCIYELDPVAMVSTGTKICPATAAAPIGLAYDPVSDTFLAGSWDDGVINRFDRSGTVLDSVNVNLNIAGLAYNPSTRHLFVLVNDAVPADVYVLDTADNFRVLRSFAIQDLGDYEQGGLEIDCAGNLWAVDQVSGDVLEVASGETGACDYMNAPWLDVSPTSGTLSANGSQTLTLDASTAGQWPGLHQAQVHIVADPLAPLDVPVCFTVAFHDVASTFWADEYIHSLAGARISTGCGNDNFCPTDLMTRGVMARWLVKAYHGPDFSPMPCTGIFADVPCETTANADYIEQLYADGITTGCQTDPLMYCPDNPVTRAQMTAFITRTAYGPTFTPPAPTGTIFTDVPQTFWAAGYIEWLYNEGVVDGYPDGTFRPTESTYRGQMSKMVVNSMNLPMCQMPAAPKK